VRARLTVADRSPATTNQVAFLDLIIAMVVQDWYRFSGEKPSMSTPYETASKVVRPLGLAATLTAIAWGITQLFPSLRDLWDTSVLLGLFAVILVIIEGAQWLYRRIGSKAGDTTP
jgi:hypothetical protein